MTSSETVTEVKHQQCSVNTQVQNNQSSQNKQIKNNSSNIAIEESTGVRSEVLIGVTADYRSTKDNIEVSNCFVNMSISDNNVWDGLPSIINRHMIKEMLHDQEKQLQEDKKARMMKIQADADIKANGAQVNKQSEDQFEKDIAESNDQQPAIMDVKMVLAMFKDLKAEFSKNSLASGAE